MPWYGAKGAVSPPGNANLANEAERRRLRTPAPLAPPRAPLLSHPSLPEFIRGASVLRSVVKRIRRWRRGASRRLPLAEPGGAHTLERDLRPAFDYKPGCVGHRPWVELFDKALVAATAEEGDLCRETESPHPKHQAPREIRLLILQHRRYEHARLVWTPEG